jgi:hypothetical protein
VNHIAYHANSEDYLPKLVSRAKERQAESRAEASWEERGLDKKDGGGIGGSGGRIGRSRFVGEIVG